jgi:DNA-directed RNA polymerase sigma subunit (sigma70/sigma32)
MHLDWVLSAAQQRANRGLSQGDLFQEGTIGLIEAIASFRGIGETDFKAFAQQQVATKMESAIEIEASAVRDSRMLVEAAEDFERAEIAVRRDLGRGGTDAELAQKLEWTVQRTAEVRQIVADARRRHDEELIEFLEPEDIDLDSTGEERRNGNDR